MAKFATLRIANALWRSGWLQLSLHDCVGVFTAWRRCGSTFAYLAGIAAARFPDNVAIHDDFGSVTFTDLMHQAERLAAKLQTEHNVQQGTQVALICKNHRGFVIGLLAVCRLGSDLVLLSPHSPAFVVERILQEQQIDIVLYDDEIAHTIAPGIAATQLSVQGELQRLKMTSIAPESLSCLGHIRRSGRIVVLTSGSTGIPKGVRRQPSIKDMLPVFAALLERLPLQLGRPAILAIPLFHGYGLATLAMALLMGSPLYLSNSFEIAPLIARVPQNTKSILVTVPTLLMRWLRDYSTPPETVLAAIITGSAPLEPSLCSRLLEKFGPVLFNLYGSTEAGILCMATPGMLREAPGTVGLPLPGTALRILDNHGNPVAQGDTGRISVKNSLALKPGLDGWYETGDVGFLDKDDRLFVVGRTDNMFVSGGENVYPEATESVLCSHPEVLEAAITVIPDEEFGHRMVAVVVPKKDQAFDEASIRTWLRDRLERHTLPRSIHPVEEIPRNALGKIDRKALALMISRLQSHL